MQNMHSPLCWCTLHTDKEHCIQRRYKSHLDALIIDSISRTAWMHQHLCTRDQWWKYTPKWSLTPFTSQLQTVLTAYYQDIKGVVSASGCTKSKVVKRKFEDQTCARRRRRRRRRGRRRRQHRSSRIRLGGASTGPQPWGQEGGRQGYKLMAGAQDSRCIMMTEFYYMPIICLRQFHHDEVIIKTLWFFRVTYFTCFYMKFHVITWF